MSRQWLKCLIQMCTYSFKCEIFISKVLTIMSFGPAVYRQGVRESVGWRVVLCIWCSFAKGNTFLKFLTCSPNFTHVRLSVLGGKTFLDNAVSADFRNMWSSVFTYALFVSCLGHVMASSCHGRRKCRCQLIVGILVTCLCLSYLQVFLRIPLSVLSRLHCFIPPINGELCFILRIAFHCN